MGIADGIGVGGGEIKVDSLSGSARPFRGSGVLVVGWDPVRSGGASFLAAGRLDQPFRLGVTRVRV
jgi:hypothetical protein